MDLAMNNLMQNWWRSLQFLVAMTMGNTHHAEEILREIQDSGTKLLWTEKLYRNKILAEEALQGYKNEVATLIKQLEVQELELEFLKQQLEVYQLEETVLKPDEKFLDFIYNSFNLIEHDANMLQCTGIEQRIFDDFEANLYGFLNEEFQRLKRQPKFNSLVQEAINDINKIKQDQDPEYNLELSSHIYLMRCFLDNVYCAYLAWFFIYKSKLLPAKLNILDLAAGPSTIAYGLALLLESNNAFSSLPPIHLSYYSLEQQKAFQYRGLQLWRQYMECQTNATNAYFRFHTANIFDYPSQANRIPQKFFDFITISHCFFYNLEVREKYNYILQQIFTNHLKTNGHVLLIIQDKKLFMSYGVQQTENHEQEESVVRTFVKELGLNLVWYKYLTSTNSREYIADFGKFAQENLPLQSYISPMARQYLQLKHDLNYTLDDYVILAKK